MSNVVTTFGAFENTANRKRTSAKANGKGTDETENAISNGQRAKVRRVIASESNGNIIKNLEDQVEELQQEVLMLDLRCSNLKFNLKELTAKLVAQDEQHEHLREMREICMTTVKNMVLGQIEKYEKATGQRLEWRYCKVCAALYTATGANVPRMLQCGHTFCECCIGALLQKEEASCPTCKKEYSGYKIEDFQKNFSLIID